MPGQLLDGKSSASRPRGRAVWTCDLFVEPLRVAYNLHPPLLRVLGLKRKPQFGPWFRPELRLLRGMKGLRGTPLDIFGYATVRKEERGLIGWYRELVESALEYLSPDTYPMSSRSPGCRTGSAATRRSSSGTFGPSRSGPRR
jgi:hypothetical protein